MLTLIPDSNGFLSVQIRFFRVNPRAILLSGEDLICSMIPVLNVRVACAMLTLMARGFTRKNRIQTDFYPYKSGFSA
jgi:hypothetical protein